MSIPLLLLQPPDSTHLSRLTNQLYTFLVQESESAKEPEMALVREEMYWMM
jgi:hypothetical protein